MTFKTSHSTFAARVPETLAWRALLVLLVLALVVAGCSDEDGQSAGDLSDDATDVSGLPDLDTDARDTTSSPDSAHLDSDDLTPSACGEALRPNADLNAATQLEVVAAGIYANAIAIDGDVAYVVNSGDNAIQRFTLSDPDGSNDTSFVDVGADKNPYDLAVFGDRLYVTNSMEGSITVADTDGNVLSTTVIPELVGPQGIVATQDYLLVANTEFTWPTPEGRFGSLVVLTRTDTPALVNRVETTQSNPQFVTLVGDTVYVINSGATQYDMDTYVVSPSTPGGVDVFPLTGIASAVAPSAHVSLPPVGLVGNPGRPAIVGSTLYLGSGTAPTLFAVDLAGPSLLRGANDPIVLADDVSTNALVAPFAGPGGLLYALNFNADTMMLIDPACDEVVGSTIPLGTNDELLEGPLTLAWSAGGEAYVVMSASAAITRVATDALLR